MNHQAASCHCPLLMPIVGAFGSAPGSAWAFQYSAATDQSDLLICKKAHWIHTGQYNAVDACHPTKDYHPPPPYNISKDKEQQNNRIIDHQMWAWFHPHAVVVGWDFTLNDVSDQFPLLPNVKLYTMDKLAVHSIQILYFITPLFTTP